ncbi:MAG TPA: hypothetical protein VE665_06360, partial [Hyphomicrobiaceae bacterium]|nr:hypothetical protein [Hyphomicrobiaceae bacterium]
MRRLFRLYFISNPSGSSQRLHSAIPGSEKLCGVTPFAVRPEQEARDFHPQARHPTDRQQRLSPPVQQRRTS